MNATSSPTVSAPWTICRAPTHVTTATPMVPMLNISGKALAIVRRTLSPWSRSEVFAVAYRAVS